MKKNQFNELKQLDAKAIVENVKRTKLEIADLVMDKNMSKLKDLKVIQKKRKDLAQMLTVLRQKQMVEELEGKVSKAPVDTVSEAPTKVVSKAPVQAVEEKGAAA